MGSEVLRFRIGRMTMHSMRKYLRHTLASATAIAAFLITGSGTASGQDILLDEVVRAGDLRLYRSLRDDNGFYYLADQARLATGESGDPQFSFLKYEQGGSDTGGGIFHAVVSLEVTEEQLREARRELGRIDPRGEIKGPVPFDGGTFALVTSFNDENDEFTRQVVGLGYAPVLDGQKAAVSIRLTDQGADVMAAALLMATADFSFSFEMDLSGYRSPIEAVVTATYEDIYRHDAFSAAMTTPLLAGEIMTEFEKLRQERTITFEQVGEDEDIERLAEAAYNKLIEVLFQPVRSQLSPEVQNQTGLLDRATKMLASARQQVRDVNARIRGENERRRREVLAARARAYAEKRQATGGKDEPVEPIDAASTGVYRSVSMASAGVKEPKPEAIPLFIGAGDTTMPEPAAEEELPEFAAVASYLMKRQERSGTFTFNFNKHTVETRRLRFDHNIGDLSSFASDERFVRTVDLHDFSIQRRIVRAYLDGLNADEFRDHLNFVTVQLRKAHRDGTLTTDEIRIDAGSFSEEGNAFELNYRRKTGDGQSDWLAYDYTATWSFKGYDPVVQEVENAAGAAIALSPPFRVRTVTLDMGDPDRLTEENVRMVTVRVFGPGDRILVNETLRPDREPVSKIIEFLAPADMEEYVADISWSRRGGDQITTGKVAHGANLIFLDELP